MEAPEIGAYVNRDNVPLLEDPVPGNPMITVLLTEMQALAGNPP